MGTSTQVYGDRSSWWDVFNYPNDTPDNMRMKAYAGSLNVGFDTGTRVNRSTSFCGIGTESSLSHIKYFDFGEMAQSGITIGDDLDFASQDARSETRWCFGLRCKPDGYASFYNTSPDQPGSRVCANRLKIYTNSTGGWQTDPTFQRYSPSPVNPQTFAGDVSPITSLNFKNTVLVITVVSVTNLINATNPTSSNIHKNTLYDWVNNVGNCRTNSPYCIAIELTISSRSSSTGAWSPYSIKSESGYAVNGLGITILDSLNGYNIGEIGPAYNYIMFIRNGATFPLLGAFINETRIATVVDDRNEESTWTGKVFAPVCCPDTWSVKLLKKEATNRGIRVEAVPYREYDETFQEEIRREVAHLGCFFIEHDTNWLNYTANKSLLYGNPNDSNDGVMLGIIEEGITHGNYSIATDNEEQLQWEIEDSNEVPYNPESAYGLYDPFDWSGKISSLENGLAVGGNWYVDPNLGTWNGLLTWCNAIDLSSDTYDKSVFFGQNPIDCILEARYIFVTDWTFGKSYNPTKQPIRLGSYSDGGVTTYQFQTAKAEVFHIGDIGIDPPYPDFRALVGATISINLPFVQSIELPIESFMGHTVNVDEVIDPMSGDLMYVISCDGNPMFSATGNCAMDLAINGLQISIQNQQRFQLQTQQNTSAFNALASAIGGLSGGLIAASYHNVWGAGMQIAGGLVNAAKGVYNADRYGKQAELTAAPPAKIQNASANLFASYLDYPNVTLTYSKTNDNYFDSEYKQQLGFATYDVDTLGSQHGIVVCESPHLVGLTCTDEEQDEIRSLLSAGVIVK